MADEVTRPGSPEERLAAERQAEAAEVEAVASRGTAAGSHTVQDSYVARRLAQEAAARTAAEQRDSEENLAFRGELVEDSPVGFYMMLGVLVAALLLAVIWVSGTRQELPASVIHRARPAAPGLAGPRPGPAARSYPVGAAREGTSLPATSHPPLGQQPAGAAPGLFTPVPGSPAGRAVRPADTPPPPPSVLGAPTQQGAPLDRP